MNVKLNSIKVKNFKSLNSLKLELTNLNILIGPNDSGKSNILEIFRFLSDFFENGPLAFQKREGFWEILSKYHDDSLISFELTGEMEPDYKFKYSLEFASRKVLTFVNKESFYIKRKNHNWEEILNFNSLNEKILRDEFEHANINIILEENGYIKSSILCKSTTEISNPLAWKFINFMKSLGYFNFRPVILTEPCKIDEELKLENNGINLPVVLQNFYNEYPENFSEYITTFHNLYSQYEFVKFKIIPPNKIYFYLEDRYGNKFPMWILSDGLIKCLCILYLFYSPKPQSIILFEEPEATIHPHLLSRLFDLFLTISEKSQIFIATHSPYFLNNSKIDDLIYVYKKEGITNTKRIKQSAVPKELQLEFKTGELYYSGFLDPEELENEK